jgi:hypothetical protein
LRRRGEENDMEVARGRRGRRRWQHDHDVHSGNGEALPVDAAEGVPLDPGHFLPPHGKVAVGAPFL